MNYKFTDLVYSEKGLKAQTEAEERIVRDYILIHGDNAICKLYKKDTIWLINLETKEMIHGEITELIESGEITLNHEFVDIEEYDILMKL